MKKSDSFLLINSSNFKYQGRHKIMDSTMAKPPQTNVSLKKMNIPEYKPIMDKIIVQSQTWDRECHGLFDFDIHNIPVLSNSFIGCGYIQRKQQQVQIQLPGLATKEAQESGDIENLLSIVFKHDQYWLFHNQSVDADYSYKNHVQMAWNVVRFSNDLYQPGQCNRYYVKQGDIIKFGRVRFKIRKLTLDGRDDQNNIDQMSSEGRNT